MNQCEEKVLEMMAACESEFSASQMFQALINGAVTLGLKNFGTDGNKISSLLEGAISSALTVYARANHPKGSNDKKNHLDPSSGDG